LNGGGKITDQVKLARERLEAAQGEADEATQKENEWRSRGHTGCVQCQGDLERAKLARERLEAAKREYEACLNQGREEEAARGRVAVVSGNGNGDSDSESSSDGVSVLEVATLLPGVGNVVGPVAAAVEKYQETGSLLEAAGAGVGDAAITAAGGKLIKAGGKLLKKGAKIAGRKVATHKVVAPKLAFATEVPASKLTSIPKLAQKVEAPEIVPQPALTPAPQPVVKKTTGNALFSQKTGTGGSGGGKSAPKAEKPAAVGDAKKYRGLKEDEVPRDNIDVHHMPSKAYMEKHGIKKGDGIAMNMKKEDHALTRTHGNRSNAQSNLEPRDELAADIRDVRKIYQKKKSYTPEIRKGLRRVIKENEKEFPHLFGKDVKK
jgi:hypothetical protein